MKNCIFIILSIGILAVNCQDNIHQIDSKASKNQEQSFSISDHSEYANVVTQQQEENKIFDQNSGFRPHQLPSKQSYFTSTTYLQNNKARVFENSQSNIDESSEESAINEDLHLKENINKRFQDQQNQLSEQYIMRIKGIPKNFTTEERTAEIKMINDEFQQREKQLAEKHAKILEKIEKLDHQSHWPTNSTDTECFISQQRIQKSLNSGVKKDQYSNLVSPDPHAFSPIQFIIIFLVLFFFTSFSIGLCIHVYRRKQKFLTKKPYRLPIHNQPIKNFPHPTHLNSYPNGNNPMVHQISNPNLQIHNNIIMAYPTTTTITPQAYGYPVRVPNFIPFVNEKEGTENQSNGLPLQYIQMTPITHQPVTYQKYPQINDEKKF